MKINNKIIASFASIFINKKIKYKEDFKLENVVASITQYNKDIDFKKVNNLIESLEKNTSLFKNKKFLVFDIGIDKPIEPKLNIEYEHLKVFDINIYSIINKTFNENYLLNINKKINKIIDDNKYSIKKDNKFDVKNYTLDLNLLTNFKYLINLNLLELIEKENLLTMTLDYNLIFIFNDIT
jgi:hypothetical protein